MAPMSASIPSDNVIRGDDTEPSEDPRHARDRHAAIASAARFAEFLHNTVPTALVPAELHTYIRREANARLDAAREAGVSLEQVTIGVDGLPTWPGGLAWDPDAESLHAHLQNRLIDWDAARELGDLVRGDIVSKGRLKLAQAREMGITLRDVYIGRNLLPEWTLGRAVSTAAAAAAAAADNKYSDFDDDDDDDSDMESITMGSRQSSGESAQTPLTDVFDTHPGGSAVEGPPSNSPVSACNSDDSSDWDDTIGMNNFVLPVPEYEEPDEDEDEVEGNDVRVAVGDSNVVHNVQVVGGQPGTSHEFDLEVYLLEDDDEDIAHMPEVELFIDDGDAYEHHYGADKAVDVELPVGHYFVPAGVEEAGDDDDDDRDGDGDEAHSSVTEPIYAQTQPIAVHDDEEEEDNIYDDSRAGSPVPRAIEEEDGASSQHSEEVTDDENGRGDEGEEAAAAAAAAAEIVGGHGGERREVAAAQHQHEGLVMKRLRKRRQGEGEASSSAYEKTS
ncbi:hypothetical protein JDV02_008351 [Purpureocillium takamizusanense]|uniref:Uncharacterized protein n=1 Tax=Purpureocillium takamizusanense TaxID=2060973 RepID=A0A9Q8QQ38_9HYPO|nr:uncharacterized protein JDV02_008351 [Purpureocillium takamizusanense]UNI22462.1 hypothetical protein JDV02_008351 [Purpureocillium takamizusanense]